MSANRPEDLQITLAEKVSAEGVGLHSGKPVRLVLGPAPVGSGIVFQRTDLSGRPEIPARLSSVVETDRHTVLARGCAYVATVEHLMAAFYGMGVDNAWVRLDAEELPAFDGSARPFVRLILKAGLRRQQAAKKSFRPRRKIVVRRGKSLLAFAPAKGLSLDCRLSLEGVEMKLCYHLSPRTFAEQIAPARTFGLLRQAEELRRRGLAQGASLKNVVVFEGGRVLNTRGLRFPDEPARHKLLDLIGDLALLGRPLEGKIFARQAGHALHFELCKRLSSRRKNV